MIDYTLNRSKRKTLALYVRDGAVEIRAPLKAPKSAIDKFVVSKDKWITDKLAISTERAEQRDNFYLNYGDKILYRGKHYPVGAKDGNRVGFDEMRFYMPPGLSAEQIKYACVEVYRMLAKRYLTARTSYFAGLMSVTPLAVKINGAKTRWGSCSAKKSLNFSWRLMMADDGIIDYVVVHELAHITEMNHSERFWGLVNKILPDVNVRKKKLKELQSRLASENWE